MFFAEKGLRSITLAKEITLDDICAIALKTGVKADILAHGPVNMFHSKRMLITNYFRHFNNESQESFRNKPLSITEEMRLGKYPLIEDDSGTHIFSPYDLCTVNYLDVLIENNVSSLRIDGMFKTFRQLYDITAVYRKALDDYFADKENYLIKRSEYLRELAEIENIRPFNTGFLLKKTIYKGEDYD